MPHAPSPLIIFLRRQLEKILKDGLLGFATLARFPRADRGSIPSVGKTAFQIFAVLACFFQSPASAQTAPAASQASPDIYKVLAENDQFRITLATWKPGEKDSQHSHPSSAAYRLTDCKLRVTAGDGRVLAEGEQKAGGAMLQGPVPSHGVENIGSADCQVLIVERK